MRCYSTGMEGQNHYKLLQMCLFWAGVSGYKSETGRLLQSVDC